MQYFQLKLQLNNVKWLLRLIKLIKKSVKYVKKWKTLKEKELMIFRKNLKGEE